MSALQQWDTLAVSEMLRDQREVSKLMQVTRDKVVPLSKNPDDWDVFTQSMELLVAGRVEYNPETDWFWTVWMIATDKDGDEVELSDAERQEAAYLLINEYFFQVWG